MWAPSRAEEPAKAQPAPTTLADTQTAKAPIQDSEEMERSLRETQQMLREQSDMLRQMRQQIERQQSEIETLRLQRPAGTTTSLNGDPQGDAGRLQAAAASLRASVPVVARLKLAQEGKLPEPPTGDLYFRLGNATFTPNGWIDFTTYYRSTDVGSGLGTTFAGIPYNNSVQGGQSEVRLTAQSSRIGFRVDESVGNVHAYGYLEADFNGYLPGNAYVSTNSNTLRMRVYYLDVAGKSWEILGGQGWSLLTPTRKALSPFLADLFTTFHLDTSYQAGLTYARQTQLRFVYHPGKYIATGLSVENPEQFSGSAVTFPTLFSNTETDINSSSGSGGATATPNVHPDIILKTTFDRRMHGLYWHAGVAGLLTSTRVFTPGSVTKGASASDEREGGGGVANINFEMFKGFRLISTGYWSDGGGRYMGGMGPGFVVLQQESVTAPFSAALIHSGSGIGGFEWDVPGHTTIASYYSSAYFQRRYGLDPDVKTPTYIGYGFPGSANTNNRTIHEITFASISTLWQSSAYGALQIISQSSYVERDPWYVAPNSPKNAHTFMGFMNLRYVVP